MLQSESIRRLIRFGTVGVVVMFSFMAMNWLLGHWCSALVAFLVAYPPAVTLHFCLNKWWTFGCARTDMGRQVTEYLVMVAVTFVVQFGFFWLAHDLCGLAGWLAAGVANAAQMALSFLIMQRKVFARRPGPTPG
jgi:putative flippase GtrA